MHPLELFEITRLYRKSPVDIRKKFLPIFVMSKLLFWYFFVCITLRLKKYACFVALKNNRIIGFAYINRFQDHSNLGIMVKEEYQSQGIGSALMREIIKRERNIKLNVLSDNKKAIEFYTKLGFKHDKTIFGMRLENDIKKK